MPRTITGQGLAAFLRGLLPETRQFDRQIRSIEDEAAAAVLGRFQVCDVCNAVFLGRGWCHDQPTSEIR